MFWVRMNPLVGDNLRSKSILFGRRRVQQLLENNSMLPPEDILNDDSPLVRLIAQRLRELIRATVPAMTERAYPGWHGIGFRHPRSGYVCGIFPGRQSVKLVFEYGVQLLDPDQVLQGDGKQTRHLELFQENDIPTDSITQLLLEAVALRDGR